MTRALSSCGQCEGSGAAAENRGKGSAVRQMLVWVVLGATGVLSLPACYAQRGVFVQQKDSGASWPFCVAAVYIACPEPDTLIVYTDQASYALNETAKAKGLWRDLGEIRRADPNRAEEYMSIDFFIKRGVLLCK